MEIQRYQTDPTAMLKLKGRLDARLAEHLEGAMGRDGPSGTVRLVLDAAGGTFMSFAGIRVLLVHSSACVPSVARWFSPTLRRRCRPPFHVRA
jgi:anti-anti-sigma regulatory factor